MSNTHEHLSEDRFQALLDGELAPSVAARLRAEVSSCARCSAEFDAWQTLFEDLGDLSALAPSVSFSDRIMDSLPTPRRQGLAGWVSRAQPIADHVDQETLQDLLDQRLAARVATRVEGHLENCAVCRTEFVAFRQLATSLETLPTLAPSHEFSERVMAGVRVRQMVAFAMAPVTRQEKILATLRAMVPSTRQGWAAAMGVMVTPLTLAVLILRSIFSNPLVTTGNLFSFAWLKGSDAVGAVLGSIRDTAMQQGAVAQVVEVVQNVGMSSTTVAASLSILTCLALAAIWVLYRNVLTSPVGEGSYARLSF